MLLIVLVRRRDPIADLLAPSHLLLRRLVRQMRQVLRLLRVWRRHPISCVPARSS
jgi:hypothetical protein